MIHHARAFARSGSSYQNQLKGFAEFFRRTMGDWKIDDMDLAEAQLIRVIEQIGARKLVALSLGGAPLNRSTK